MVHSIILLSISLMILALTSVQPFPQCESCSSIAVEDYVSNNCSEEKYIVCYFTNWAWYRSTPVNFKPENINASLCTHIFYAFSSLDSTSLEIVTSDSWADIDNKFFELVTAFKKCGLKVLLSIGGWNNSGGSHWSRLVSNATARANFVTSATAFLHKYNFDGLDLDYEYPGCPQGDISAALPTDKSHFNIFVSELKVEFDKWNLILTVTVAAGETLINKCYNMAELCQLADWINIMGYEYNSYTGGLTAPGAPLYGTGSSWGVYDTIRHFRNEIKCPAKKLVLGMPFYGQSYTIESSLTPEFGVAVSGPGVAGTYTKSAGTLAYYEICLNIKEGWHSSYNNINGSYAWNSNQFVSYDSELDIISKCHLINKCFNLKGAMFWALDYDDFNNICGGGSYPLLKTLNQHLRGSV